MVVSLSERAMAAETKTLILEYLGRRHDAMVGLLADLVNIDSGTTTSAESTPSGIGCGRVSKEPASSARPSPTPRMAIA